MLIQTDGQAPDQRPDIHSQRFVETLHSGWLVGQIATARSVEFDPSTTHGVADMHAIGIETIHSEGHCQNWDDKDGHR